MDDDSMLGNGNGNHNNGQVDSASPGLSVGEVELRSTSPGNGPTSTYSDAGGAAVPVSSPGPYRRHSLDAHDPMEHLGVSGAAGTLLVLKVLFILHIIFTIVAIGLLVTIYALKIHHGCFTSLSPDGSLSKFRDSKDVCDLSAAVTGGGTYVLGQSITYGGAGVILTFRFKYYFALLLFLASALQAFVVIPLVITMVAMQFPFWEFAFPAILFGVLCLLCLAGAGFYFSRAKLYPPPPPQEDAAARAAGRLEVQQNATSPTGVDATAPPAQ